MPSGLHEAITELFRHRPALAAEVLERCLRLDLPGYKEARLAGGDLPKLQPAERRADAVVMLHREHAAPVLAIIVEVQLREDQRKRRTWPDYLTGLHSRYACPAILLVVCPGRATAAWAAGPIPIGHPGFVLRPLVLGPDLMPAITDVDEAVARTELAVLSGIAHGADKAVRNAVFTALAVFSAQDMDLATLYADVIVAELPKALRKTAEEELRAKTVEYKSDFAKSYFSQGEAKGREEGRAEGKAEDILAVLAARGIAVTPDQESQIRQCTDLDRLGSWLRRAVTAESTEQVLALAPPTGEDAAKGWARSVLIVLAARGIARTPEQEVLIKQCTDLGQLDKWVRRAATAESADQVFALGVSGRSAPRWRSPRQRR